jgi:hypothetical protein
MGSGFMKGVLVGALVAAIVTMAGTAVAGTGIGAVFNLGKTNSVDKTSILAGKTPDRVLQVTNRGAGPALGLTVKAGKPPLVVNSKAVVADLNADALDGAHLFRVRRSFPVPTMTAWPQPHPLFTVPGFGTICGYLYQGFAVPCFLNTQANEDVQVWFRVDGIDQGASVAPQGWWSPDIAGLSFAEGYPTRNQLTVFLADSKHMASVEAMYWLDGMTWRVVALGLLY